MLLLTITEAAGEYIAEMLAHSPEDLAVRLVVPGAREREEDEGLDDEPIAQLVVDKVFLGLLTDRTLDVEDAGEGPRLTLH